MQFIKLLENLIKCTLQLTFVNDQSAGPTFQSWPRAVCERVCGCHGYAGSLILVLKKKKKGASLATTKVWKKKKKKVSKIITEFTNNLLHKVFL